MQEATFTPAASPVPTLGLPARAYTDGGLFALEARRLLLPAWQIVCHESDIPSPGDYACLDFLGRPAVVLRDEGGGIRGFYNVCRHRGARIADPGPLPGRCVGGRLTCPYHGWSYDLAGRLAGVPGREGYPGLDDGDWDLTPVETSRWAGFVFVRFCPGGPGLADLMAPFAELIEACRIPEMRALGRVTRRPRRVNWKLIVENYTDGRHLPVAHRGLSALAGDSYRLEAAGGVMHMSARVDGGAGGPPSVALYRRLLPEAKHLPGRWRRHWNYFLIWPNLALDIYPEQVDFMHIVPLGPGESLIREIPYGLPDAGRAMRAARYLNWRINREVNAEDTDLLERVQAGMASGAYTPGPLAGDEVCLRALAARYREAIPEAITGDGV